MYFIAMPKTDDVERPPWLATRPYHALVVPGIGFYDGAFGPGTGSFFTAAGVSMRGQRLVAATAQARLLNFGTNAASLVVFSFGGKLVMMVGLVMAVGQVMGAYLGAAAVAKGGARLVRPLVVVMCVAMLIQYLWKQGYLPV
ncbi:MAG: TSUP family transporter [Stackebrandtia sp.]